MKPKCWNGHIQYVTIPMKPTKHFHVVLFITLCNMIQTKSMPHFLMNIPQLGEELLVNTPVDLEVQDKQS